MVESAIQKGEVVLICATGTLAEGINFPVINVLTTQRMYASNVDEKSQGGRRPPCRFRRTGCSTWWAGRGGWD